MNANISQNTHNNSLHGLRGLAAAIVVIQHYLTGLYPAMAFAKPETARSSIDLIIATTPLQLLISGHFAVCIFFILSAHVLTIKLIPNNEGVKLIQAMTKRYPRLGIPVFFGVIFAAIASWIFSPTFKQDIATLWQNPIAMMTQSQASIIDIMKDATYGAMLLGSNKYNQPLWTINIEFIGSMGIFLALFIIPQNNRTWRLIFYFAALLATCKTYYSAFILGMTISEIKFTKPKVFHSGVTCIVLIAGLLLGSVPMYHPDLSTTPYRLLNTEVWRPAYHILGAYMVIVAILNSPKIEHLLSLNLFRKMGDISFSMYLIHIIIIQTVSYKLIQLIEPHLGIHQATAIAAIPTIATIAISSHFFMKLIDTPAVNFSNRIGNYFKNRCSMQQTSLESNKFNHPAQAKNQHQNTAAQKLPHQIYL